MSWDEVQDSIGKPECWCYEILLVGKRGKKLLRSETLLFPLEGAADCDGIEVMGGGEGSQVRRRL